MCDRASQSMAQCVCEGIVECRRVRGGCGWGEGVQDLVEG